MKNKRNILALDVATLTGFAHTNGKSGVWNLETRKGEHLDARLWRLWNQLTAFEYENTVEEVVYETSFIGRHMRAAMLLGEFRGVLKLWCLRTGVKFEGFSPQEIKKHATGSGAANKAKMIEAAKEKFGIEIIDDNHADALHLLDFYKEELKKR